jgi:Protein of unknown function (DUF3048) N-terminal domain/Protein of unknown function (DUF3048) C-terminal domain
MVMFARKRRSSQIRSKRIRPRQPKQMQLVALIIAAAMLVASCSDDEKSSTEPGGDGSSGAATQNPPEPQTEPLTGVELKKSQSAERPHSVLVVKMDNTYSSSPQAGLSKADLVVEELVEGGLTRLAAFFYSQTPRVVGPVRSMRASDIGIVSPVEASVVTSGAAAVTIGRIRQAKIRFFEEGVEGIYRDDQRAAPYNVFANLSDIAKKAKNPDGRPQDYLPWGDERDFVGARPAKAFDVAFGPGHTTEWEFRAGKYVNVNSYAAPDDQFPADTVLVLKAEVGDAGYTDPAGNPVPETKLEGSGPAIVFHGGQLVRGTWRKEGLDGALKLSTKSGKLTVPAGRVWLELIPKTGGSVTVR